MNTVRLRWDGIAPILLGVCLASIYLTSLAPGLTWANDGADGGDLIAATATGGVAHPTGYPVYMLMARPFQLLPIGALAWRTNLLSAVSTVAAALLVYGIVKRALGPSRSNAGAWGGFIGGMALGLTPLVWSQAVITEVYSLNLAFIALLLYLSSFPVERRRRRGLLIGLVQGLAAGNQILAGLLIPVTLVCASLRRRGGSPKEVQEQGSRRGLDFDPSALLNAALGVVIGLLSYAILPLRAAAKPPVNWGNVVTADRFLWLISGKLYQAELLQIDLPTTWTHVQAWAGVMLQSVGVPGLAIALLGLVVFFVPSRLHILTLYVAAGFSVFSTQYQVVDSYVYLLPVLLSFAIWIGLGAARGIESASERWNDAGVTIGVLCLAYFAVLGYRAWSQVDAAHDWRAETFGWQVMNAAPANAILFAQDDQAIFGLWYFQYALKQRPDLTVIATDLLPFDWYRQGLRQLHPEVIIPDVARFPWLYTIRQANPGRPTCYPYGGETALNCQ